MSGIYEYDEFARIAEVRAAEKSAERESGALGVRLGPYFEFARPEHPAQVVAQFLAIVEHALPQPGGRYDVGFNYSREFLQERLLRQCRHFRIVGQEHSLQIGSLIDSPRTHRFERHF